VSALLLLLLLRTARRRRRRSSPNPFPPVWITWLSPAAAEKGRFNGTPGEDNELKYMWSFYCESIQPCDRTHGVRASYPWCTSINTGCRAYHEVSTNIVSHASTRGEHHFAQGPSRR
jgi:hypothetical protein